MLFASIGTAHIRRWRFSRRSAFTPRRKGRSRVFAVVSFDSAELRPIADAMTTDAFELTVIETPNVFANFPEKMHITNGCLLRFLLPDLLPSLDKVLYLDSDIIVNVDLAALYDTDVAGTALAATPDFASLFGSQTWRNYRVPHGGKLYRFAEYMTEVLALTDLSALPYFNSGVLLMNFDYWRRHAIGERAIERAKSGDLHFVDQDALNYLLAENFVRLDARWNCMAMSVYPRFLPANLFTEAGRIWERVRKIWRTDPWVIHFAGPNKPWNAREPRTHYDAIWWTFAMKSPMAAKIRARHFSQASIFRNKIPAPFR